MNTGEPQVRDAIVVGVDTSPAARLAAAWAAHQADLEGRRLVLVRTTGSLSNAGSVFLDSREPSTSSVLQAMHGDGVRVVAEISDQLRHVHPELRIDDLVVDGDAVHELRRMSEEAHLVVVGSDGHGLAPHGTPWQVGARVVRRAACPVVVVPRHPSTVGRGVLVGDDLTARSGPVLRFAYRIASLRGLPLTVMHAARETAPDRVQDAERALAETVSGLGEEFPDVPVRLNVTHGWPTGRLLEESPRMHLLVIGQHHDPGAFESPLGHVRAGLVARAECPVAVVPFGSGDASDA